MNRSTSNSSDAGDETLSCIFEKILSEHIQQKIAEERLRYDAALVRANDMLIQTKKLKEQVRALAEDFYQLENQFQGVAHLNVRFKRAAMERFDYLEHQSYLAGVIASLMAQYRDLDTPGNTCYSPRDWRNLRYPAEPREGRRMSKQKRRLLYKLMCAKGGDGF